MKRKYIISLIFVLIILLLTITNPSEQNHKDKVKFKINQLLQNQNDKSSLSKIGAFLGGLVLEKFISNSVSCRNYVLFSLTTFSWNGDTKIIGYGVLGNVFLSKKVEEGILSHSSGSSRIVIAEGEKKGVLSIFNKINSSEQRYKGTLITSSNSGNRIYSFEHEFYVEDINVAKKLENAVDKVVTIYFKEYEDFLNNSENSLFLVEKIEIHE